MSPPLRLVEHADLWPAVCQALTGGRPVVPLPDDPASAARTAAMARVDEPLEASDIAVLVATSGSTGTPKGVLLSAAAIAAACAATHARLGGPGTWHTAVPTSSVAGLMVLARAFHAGTEPVTVASDLHDAQPGAGRTYLSLVPTQLHAALRHQGLVERLSGFTALLLGGAAASPALLDEAQARGLNVVTTYGMSETCGGCVYDGRPLAGVDVTLDAEGRISLTAPMAFSGYRLQPQLTTAVLDGQTVRTNDRGSFAEGRLTVLGRVDDVVVSGGVNVDLSAVERLARGLLPGAEVAVVGVPDPRWGARIELVTDGEPGDVRARLAERLEPAAVPKHAQRFAALPLTASGKIDRQRLVEVLAQGPVGAPSDTAAGRARGARGGDES